MFIGGASYGAMAPVAKLAGADGFSWQQIACSQGVFGVAVFALAFALQLAWHRNDRATVAAPLSPKGTLALLGTGCTTAATCLLYNLALSRLPVAVAITMLFQFTWVGIVIQVIATRRAPRATEVLAAGIVVVGTLFASGLVGSQLAITYDPLGIACGLASSVSCALFMFLSGKVETKMPRIQRGLIVCIGAMVITLFACPDYFTSGVLAGGIAPYGVVLGLTALFIPVTLFGIGTPHLPTGVSTVLAASELPASITMTYLATGVGVTTLQVLGIVAILTGVAVSQLPSRAAKQARPKR